MIDWWVISSVLAGLGTAYGANVYNTKDATELRKKAAELIASSETKEWADRVKDLQARLDRAQQDNKRAEELVAQLQTAATGVQSGITTTMSDLQGQLQAETSPVQSQLATAPQETYGRALAMVLTELQQRYGISVTPKMDGVLKQFERNRHSIRDLWAALKEAYEKDTAPKGGKRRRRRGGADTPAEAEQKKAVLAETAPTPSPADSAALQSFLDTEAPAAAPAPEPPAAADVVPLPPVPGAPTPFPSLEEFQALWSNAFAQQQPPPMASWAPPGMPMAPPPPAPLTKKDIEARKAAQALADKLTRAWDTAVKDVAPYTEQAKTLPAEAKAVADDAYVALTTVFADIGRFIPQLTQQDVRESSWKTLKEVGTILANRVPGAVKVYKDAVGSLPSGFLSMFKTKQAAPTVSTARHDAFVQETSDSIASVEGGGKEIAKLEKAIRYQIDTFFNPPEKFRGGCTLVAKDAKAALDAMEASKQQLAAAAEPLKAVKAEFKKYTDAAKGSLVADSVLPPVAPAPPPPPPPPPPPGPAPLSETSRAAVKSRVEEIADQVKARRAAEDAAERATPRPWNPMIPLPSGPPPEGGAFWSSKPSKVVEESPELATLYTSVMTKRSEIAPAVAAYTAAKARGQTVLQALQDMHSQEKAYLRLTSPEDQAKERESCGYIAEDVPSPPAAPVLSAPFELPDTGTAMLTNPLRPLGPPETGVLDPSLAPLVDRVPDKELIRSISSQLRPTTKGPTPGSWWHENADVVRKLVAAWFATWKALTKEEKKASKAEAETAAQALEQAAAPVTPPTGGAEDTLLEDIRTELKDLEGGVRKSTFKRRRKGKQNGGRVSRRRKDRADRSHSHAR